MPRYVDMSGWDSFMNDMLDSRNMYDQYDNGYTDAMDRVDDWLDEQPTIDPESLRPHGRWEKSEDGYCGLALLECSLCRGECFDIDEDIELLNYRYCPNCGAKMDAEE